VGRYVDKANVHHHEVCKRIDGNFIFPDGCEPLQRTWKVTCGLHSSCNLLLKSCGFYRTPIVSSTHDICEEELNGQYKSQIQNNKHWVGDIRRDARYDFSDDWIDQHVPYLDETRVQLVRRDRSRG
jgi:hypothetical protein